MDMPFYLYINISNTGIGERNKKYRSTCRLISFLKKTKKFDIINQLYQEEILRKIKKEG